MPKQPKFSPHDHLIKQGWKGKGTALKHGHATRPLPVVQKKSASGIGKDRDESIPFWDHIFAATAASIASGGSSSGASTPIPGGHKVLTATRAPTMSIAARSNREVARRRLYSSFFRGSAENSPKPYDPESEPTSLVPSPDPSTNGDAGEEASTPASTSNSAEGSENGKDEKRKEKKEKKAGEGSRKEKKQVNGEETKEQRAARRLARRAEKEAKMAARAASVARRAEKTARRAERIARKEAKAARRDAKAAKKAKDVALSKAGDSGAKDSKETKTKKAKKSAAGEGSVE